MARSLCDLSLQRWGETESLLQMSPLRGVPPGQSPESNTGWPPAPVRLTVTALPVFDWWGKLVE